MNKIQIISSQTVHKMLDYPSLVAGLRESHKTNVDLSKELLLEQPTGDESEQNVNFNVLAAWQRDNIIGAKLTTIFSNNIVKYTNLPNVQSVFVLFDGTNGTPSAYIDGNALTLRKTAGDSALGSYFLARKNAKSMLMIGAGEVAPHAIQAHRAVRPQIQSVGIWNRTHERANEIAHKVKMPGLDVHTVQSLEEAAQAADIICCATSSTEPLLRGEWLRPGTHVDLIGGWTPSMRESDDEVMCRATIFVDSYSGAVTCGDISAPLESGIIDKSSIVSDLYELCRGEHIGRSSANEITVFKNAGGAHLDLYTACILLERIRTSC